MWVGLVQRVEDLKRKRLRSPKEEGILPGGYFFFWLFLGLHLQYMEVARLGVQSELQLLVYTRATATQDPSCICDLHQSSQQHWILNPLTKARD